jgi:phage FluMu gp28-like protein
VKTDARPFTRAAGPAETGELGMLRALRIVGGDQLQLSAPGDAGIGHIVDGGLIDEWDLHPDQAAVYDMAYPCITWGGQLELVSAYNPEGSEHTEFARLCRACRAGERPGISFHRTTILDALDQGFAETVNEVKKARGMKPMTREEFLEQLRAGCRSRSAFETQYLCIPNRASGQQLIPSEDIQASLKNIHPVRMDFRGGEGEPDPREILPDGLFRNASFSFGYDIARTGDLSCIWLNRRGEDSVQIPAAVLTFKNCRFEFQKQMVRRILGASCSVVGCGDKTGLGMAVCEELEEQFPGRFEGVNFASAKMALGTGLRTVFETRKILLPVDMPELAADFSGIRKNALASGTLQFTETGNELLPESHCDLAWSCALAVRASSMDVPDSDFVDVLPERTRGRTSLDRFFI